MYKCEYKTEKETGTKLIYVKIDNDISLFSFTTLFCYFIQVYIIFCNFSFFQLLNAIAVFQSYFRFMSLKYQL